MLCACRGCCSPSICSERDDEQDLHKRRVRNRTIGQCGANIPGRRMGWSPLTAPSPAADCHFGRHTDSDRRRHSPGPTSRRRSLLYKPLCSASPLPHLAWYPILACTTLSPSLRSCAPQQLTTYHSDIAFSQPFLSLPPHPAPQHVPNPTVPASYLPRLLMCSSNARPSLTLFSQPPPTAFSPSSLHHVASRTRDATCLSAPPAGRAYSVPKAPSLATRKTSRSTCA